ncbi:amidohydrolase family protein [Nocardioides sp.]|uniref:amidohydrolase family protein n=1 Tax=Nocardioides sp. TaxID=35761 RepID=UPI0031FEDFE9|nr:L-fuconolactonase [Nocardioides sp.]
MRIDAHHHVWDLAVRDQEWTRGIPVLRRSYLFDDLRPELVAGGVHGTIVVQTVTAPEETPELLSLAQHHPEILGVVGWVDLTDPDVAGRLTALRSGEGGEWLVGVRHQVQGESDPEWLLRPDVLRGLAAVARAGLVYELLVTHDQLPQAVAVVHRVPGLRWVLDHAGKPPIAEATLEPWRTHVSALAESTDVACKLSGLLTEAGADWDVDDLRPYAEHVLAAFGADRVMAGSDWPVCLTHASYARAREVQDDLLSGLSAADTAAVTGGTAERWYGLSSRPR